MFTSMSLIIFNFQCLLQCQLSIQFKSILIHSQFALGPTIMVMSIFKSNQYQLTLNLYLATCLVIGQVASSIQRTACTCLYAYASGQTASSIQRIVCTLLMFVIGQTTSSIQRTVCPYLHVVILIKRQVRSKEQLVSAFCLYLQVK
jgi:hypothetical protein